jgi:hypothetical protein
MAARPATSQELFASAPQRMLGGESSHSEPLASVMIADDWNSPFGNTAGSCKGFCGRSRRHRGWTRAVGRQRMTSNTEQNLQLDTQRAAYFAAANCAGCV